MATIMAETIEVGWANIGRQHHATIMGMEGVLAKVEIKVAMATAGVVIAMVGIRVTIVMLEDLGVVLRMGGDIRLLHLPFYCCFSFVRETCKLRRINPSVQSK